MNIKKTFRDVITDYREHSFSERDKGTKFERLMQAYLQTDPQFAPLMNHIWLWNEFPARGDFGGKDTGIDLVAETVEGDYWAIQCKCYQEDTTISKPEVDTFLSTSSRKFSAGEKGTIGFSKRMWIDTTGKLWGANAEEAIHNQDIPVNRITLHHLEDAPVDWDKLNSGLWGETARTEKKTLRPHQLKAADLAHEHFKWADRGKMIMACGTGKTFTALKIAERETDGKGLILFLVPSIALLGQTLREWSAEASEPINALCICSDPAVSQKRKANEDKDGYSVIDLALPATTWYQDIVKQLKSIKAAGKPGMTVAFSTYQSIEVIAKAQQELLNAGTSNSAFGIFDLIICDEAHRTTGVTIASEDESAFVKVHDNQFLQARKRLYMTATPRLYNADSKAKAARSEAVLCSMDDEQLYGAEFYRIGFGEAVGAGLLTEYKVLILTVNENDMPAAVQEMVAKNDEIKTSDAAKLIGCINALSKKIIGDGGVLQANDPEPMRRAVAFCQSIPNSKSISSQFNITRNAYFKSISKEAREKLISVDARHVDGTMSAPDRDEKLSWLKDEADGCRILTNVRCLSEGVDVPSLDAVLFLSARNSQVDVVQSVGRVMRRSPGKKYGYIIIPVVVPSDVEPHKALDNNDTFAVVWSVLNALRAHDDRFNATVNKIELNKNRPDNILVGRPDYGDGDQFDSGDAAAKIATQLSLQFEQLQSVVYGRLVEKVGDRRYWEQWAKDVAAIAERQKERIKQLVDASLEHKVIFTQFLLGLHRNINPSISEDEAVEMLAQHIITRPVFEALFEGYSFVKNNAVSVSMQNMMDLLEEQGADADTETLRSFYESVRERAGGIDNAASRQTIIIELYDKFFKTAFPKMVEKLGIVYTPVEVVDFIVHSVEALLQKEFGRSVTDENVHILDPFTGTGTFMTRLLQSGLIKAKDLERKYKHELHANEIVLLAYYIAAINIENVYHDLTGHNDYEPFDGICLTDTFQLGETKEDEELYSKMFPKNSARVQAQKKAPLQVIMGNPPYSAGQKSANDIAQNQKYDKLEGRIANTYAAESSATLQNSLYDAYIKAFRWSSDRLDKNGGIIAFISNGAWIDSNAADGFRKCLQQEFSAIYVFNLRGNARTQGELRQKEAGNVFGSGSRTPISVTFLVKKPNQKDISATIYYHDIGDYLPREEKLSIINKFQSIVSPQMSLEILRPNDHGDWLNQRNNIFGEYIAIGDKDDKTNNSTFFVKYYGRGLATSRDAWCYNTSKDIVTVNIQRTIQFFNEQSRGFISAKVANPGIEVDDFIDTDSTKMSWDRQQKSDIAHSKQYSFNSESLYKSMYRPYFKQWVYFDRQLNNCVYKLPSAFPNRNSKNLMICVSGVGVTKDFSTIITDTLPDLELIGKSQCFPLYYYEEQKNKPTTLFDQSSGNEYERKDGISDFILDLACKTYNDNKITKEDIFYYVYGFLHSPDYRTRFANDLKKMLPRLPLVEAARDFWAFSKAGRKLAELHINYEQVPPPEGVVVMKPVDSNPDFTVTKMRFPANHKADKRDIIYNDYIVVQNIPAKAYEYVVNGKSAIEWIMERYQVTVNKESGIRNDPNDWANEVGNPRYILDLLLSVINVSLQTVDIVAGLPRFMADSPPAEAADQDPFFAQLKAMDREDNWEQSLDTLNDFYDDLLLAEKYEQCDSLVGAFLNYDYSLLLHQGLLTITNRRKQHLTKWRPVLYERTLEMAQQVMTPEQVKSSMRELR